MYYCRVFLYSLKKISEWNLAVSLVEGQTSAMVDRLPDRTQSDDYVIQTIEDLKSNHSEDVVLDVRKLFLICFFGRLPIQIDASRCQIESIDRSFGWLIVILIGRLIDWLVYRLIDWLIDWWVSNCVISFRVVVWSIWEWRRSFEWDFSPSLLSDCRCFLVIFSFK